MSTATLPKTSLSPRPAQDALLRAWIWLAQHPKLRIALAVAIVCTISSFINETTAGAAEDVNGAGSRDTFFFPLGGVTDSHGVGVDKYTTLPLDYGRATYPQRLIRGILMRIVWMGYTLCIFSILSLCRFILDFGWLDWLLSPFILLANTLSGILEQTGIVGLGVAVSALVISIAWLRGRMGTGIIQLVMVGLVLGLISTPMGNPSAHIKSWVSTASDYGTEAGNATVKAGSGTEATKDPVSGQIVDLALRRPYLTMSFGSDLEGDKCSSQFDDKAKGKTDAEGIRKSVLGCDSKFKSANETDTYDIFAVWAMFALATNGLLTLIVVFITFILKDAIMAAFGAVNVVLRAHLAVFPGGARQSFFNSLLQVVVNVVMIGVYIWMLTTYLWMMKSVTAALGAANVMIGNLLFGAVMTIMAVSFFLFKKRTKKIAERLAETFGNLGRGGASTPVKPSAFRQTMGNGFKAAARSGTRATGRHFKRKLATQAVSKAAVTATGAAASGGTTLLAGIAAQRVASAGWANAGHRFKSSQSEQGNAQKPSSSQDSTSPWTSGPKAMPAGVSHRQNPDRLRDHNGALPMGGPENNEQSVEGTNDSQTQQHSPTPATSLNTGHGAIPMGSNQPAPAGNKEPATGQETNSQPSDTRAQNTDTRSRSAAAAGTGAGSHRLGRPEPQTSTAASGTQAGGATTGGHHAGMGPDQTRQETRPRRTLPAGQYGSMRVNRDGTTNRVLHGEVVKEIPAGAKVARAWDVEENSAPARPRKMQRGEKVAPRSAGSGFTHQWGDRA